MFLHGIFPPITTPFYPDGKIYHRKLEQNVEHYSRTPTAGIVVLGSTGEAILLSDDERREALKTSRDAAANDKVLIAGTGVESAIDTLRLTEYAYDIGYDVAMVRTPHYYKGQMANPQNMLAFYRFVCDRSPLPVIIYNFPQATGYDIPAELVIELAEHPNLIGIKESSGSIEKVQKMVEGTRHIKRKATVTETFAAVTGRMLQAAAAPPAPTLPQAPKVARWFPSERLVETPRPQALVERGQSRRHAEDAPERGRIPGAGRSGPEARALARRRSGRRHPGLCRLRSHRVLRDLRGLERGRHGPRPRKAGAHRQGCGTHRRRTQHPGREVRHGLQRPLRRPAALASFAAHGRPEGRGREVAGEHSELRADS